MVYVLVCVGGSSSPQVHRGVCGLGLPLVCKNSPREERAFSL